MCLVGIRGLTYSRAMSWKKKFLFIVESACVIWITRMSQRMSHRLDEVLSQVAGQTSILGIEYLFIIHASVRLRMRLRWHKNLCTLLPFYMKFSALYVLATENDIKIIA